MIERTLPIVRIRAALTVLAVALAITTSAVTARQVGLGTPLAGVGTPLGDVSLTATIPVDPKITVGTLPNGLRYYIRANTQPRNRAELRLAVSAGSVLEDDDQRGLAHFVEHMAFNGTLNFPKQEVVNFMQSIGMRFGAHVNAHTGFDETVYQLQIPTDNPRVIDRSLQIMEDWAHNVTFDPEEVDKERGVILEEWRLGLGPEARMQEVQFPILLKGSRYADRSPIGRPEILQNFRHERLRQFYRDWYRPDLMAVVAVGDFDAKAIEAQIKTRFGAIPAATNPRPKPDFEVPGHPGTLYAVATDREATTTLVSVYTKMPLRDPTTVGSYRQSIIERLFSSMLSDRLQEIAQKPNAPFLAAGTSRGLFVHTAEVTSLNALVPENGIERGLEALFTEAERVARFGFTATELDRQRLNLLRGLERLAVERDAPESDALADEYIRNFINQEPIPGIAYEYAMHQRFLPEVTLSEINALAKEWAADRNRVVMISAPQKPGVTVPTGATLSAVIASAGRAAMTAYVDEVSTEPLLNPVPMPGAVARTVTRDALGITEWELSNGVRVVLKPTDFRQDEILFRAVSPGGTSLAADADYIAAETATTVIGESGLGKLSEQGLERALAGKTAFVRPEIGDTEEGLSGGASKRDLETMFQLIYLTFTQPRADAEAFRAITEQLTERLANRQALPETAFNDTLEALLTQDHPRARPLTPALIGQMNLERSLAFYKNRFADASDFTFIFVGSFDLAAMKPLVERYLGSLPALRRNEMARDLGIRPPTRVVEREVVKGVDPRSQVSVVFTGAFQNDAVHRMVVRAMAESLQGNLHRTLREDLGGTYGVSVSPSFGERPVESYRITISFACDPARTDELVRTMFDVIDRFKFNGPSPDQVSGAKVALQRDLEVNSRDNRYLLNQITYRYQYGEDVADVFDMPRLYDQLTAGAIRDAARAYLDTSRYVKVVLRPEAAR
jgi:zinc protease